MAAAGAIVTLPNHGGLHGLLSYGTLDVLHIYHLFCSNSTVDKHESREQFKVAQYTFDQAVKDAKRQYWLQQQHHLLTINQNSEFWKSMRNVGISTASNKDIPWEVVHSDGSISTVKAEVLERWKLDFEQLLNSNDADPHLMVTSDINLQEIKNKNKNKNQFISTK